MFKFILIYQLIEYCFFTYLFLTNDKYVKALDILFEYKSIEKNKIVSLYSLASLINILIVLIITIFTCFAYSIDHTIGIIVLIFLSSIKVFTHIVLIVKNHVFTKE